MPKERYEIHRGQEILKNGKYEQLPSLYRLLPEIKNSLHQLLSIQIPDVKGVLQGQKSIPQYNIETKRYITNITTIQGLDLHIIQYDKRTKQKEIFTPYSDPGYEVYAYRLCAYHRVFGKRPLLTFPATDEATRNSSKMHIPFREEAYYAYHLHARKYTEPHKFEPDADGICRLFREGHEKGPRDEEGFGLQGDTIVTNLYESFYNRSGGFHQIVIEKELLNLFLQAFIDVNRSVSGPVTNLNLKKLSQMVFTALENPAKIEDETFMFAVQKADL